MASVENEKKQGAGSVALSYFLGGALGYVLGSYLPETREVVFLAASIATVVLGIHTYFAYRSERGEHVWLFCVLGALLGAAIMTVLTLTY